jgi:peptide/nickel transport system permease protein
MIATLGFSVPTFFSGLFLIMLFSVELRWLPMVYDTTHRVEDLHSLLFQLKQMAMPVTVLALFNTTLVARFLRSSLLDNIYMDYVRTAHAKGLSRSAILFGHVLRNSLLPVMTVIAVAIPQVFAGAIVTEQVFQVNGLGHLLILGIRDGDIPLVQTLVFVFSVLIITCNILVDILYAVLDPRIRYV